MHLKTASRFFRIVFVAMSMTLLLVMPSLLRAQAPDLTTTDLSTLNRAWTWNLGATGMRGWIYHAWPATMNNDDCTLFAPYQILVTSVAADTPAAGVLAVNDVILGASAGPGVVPLFTTDARKSMGWAIGDAEARNDGILSIKRWRAGVTTDVSITLPFMGAYSDTIPYNCPKSALIMANAAQNLAQRINTQGWGQTGGSSAISALALMATGDPQYMPMIQAHARSLVPAGYVAGGDAWHYYNGVFLAEYYLLTGDTQVLPGLREYVIYAAKNTDLCGTTGHGFATLEPPGGWAEGRRRSIAPYGAINSAGLPVQLTIVLGKKAGIVDPEIDTAIANAAGFFGYYVNGGSIPYGEHQPWWGEHQINGQGREYYDHRSNGKDGMCAVLFSCMGDKPAQAEYFSRMCVAGIRGEAYGHTGQGFAYLWTQLGANMGGQKAGTEFAKGMRWDRDLKRRYDGSFIYEGGEQWGAGQAHDRLAPDGVTMINAYWDNSYQYWGNPTATYLLHAAMPLKKLYITGKGLDPVKELSTQTVTNALWAGEFASVCGSYTKEQLIAALGDYDPIVRLNAATELSTRWVSATELNTLITMAENPADIYQRNGACTALGCLKAPSAIPALTRRLKDPDKWVRSRAALALGQMDPAALAPSVPDMAQAFTENVTAPLPWDPGFDADDYLQMANGFLAGTLFGTCYNTMLNADKNLLYSAVRVGLKQPTGNCRGQLNGFVEYGLTQADVQALFPELVECAKVQTPMDTFMGGYPPIAAMRAMSRTKVQEGIQVINDNVSFYKSYALTELPKFGEAARWTLPDLYNNLANWQPSGGNYTALTNSVTSLEAAKTSSVVYALPRADPQILATPLNTGKAITLTGSSWRSPRVVCTLATQPAHGTLTGFPPNLTYIPAAGYQGMDSFTYYATDSQTTSSPATVNLVVGSGGSGLTGSYYNNMDFTAFLASRVDPSVNFDWGTTPPNGLSAGTYSVRWTGQVLAPETGTYRFSTRTSDGVRLWINGVQVINDWQDQSANIWNDSAAITLTAGRRYQVKMEYYNNTNPATTRLFWYMPSRQSQAATIIPQELLFPEAGVCLASPQDGARFGVQAGQATVTLTADTSGITGTIASVSFYSGSTLIGTTTSAPYSFTWTNVPLGQYDITVQVTDSLGQVSTSPAAAITVDNYTVPVTAGLACYFDAAVGITTDANGVVQGWQDRSGNGHHATLDRSAWNSGTASVAQNQIMSLPAVQVRAGWFDIAGKFFAKEQYVVVRSPNATWSGSGAFIGRKSYDFLSVRGSSYTINRGGTGFWDQPLACSRNGVSTFNLAPITNYMVLKITVNDNASPENLAAYPYCQIGRTENEASVDFDVAEILGYSNALSPSESALVGGYLAAKYGIATAYPATGSLANQAATAITTTSATLNATLLSNSNTYDVVAYWGPVNGGINPANWANSVSLGSGLNAASTNLSQTLTNLSPGTTYYFNCRATNGTQTIWAAAPQSFTTTSTSKDFLAFGANVSGSSATIDTVASTVLWTVPFGASLTTLAPAYTVSAQASSSPASGATLNFSTPQTYTLTGQDGSTKIYTVTVAIDNIYPASSGATLTAAQDVTTTLTTANFGYADPNSLALAAVQITALPLQGTLRLSGTAVASGDIVTEANIPNLTYQPVLYANGTPYTTIGIKVMNSNNVWSIAESVMTVNVAYANHPPTSTGAALTMKGGSYYTFWKTDFPFTDVDAGDWLTSVKVTSLPANGTLTLGGTPITTVPSAAIPATNTNTLIYTPNPGYFGADSFNYQVSDGEAFSADSAMAITVVDPNLLFVANGSFETPDPVLQANGQYIPWTDGTWTYIPSPWASSGSNYGRLKAKPGGTFTTAPDGKWVAVIGTGQTPAVPLSQDLGVSVAAGDTVSVTFSIGNGIGATGGQMVAYFKSYSTSYPMAINTTTLTPGTWQTYTLSQTIIEPGNLSLGFYWTGGGVSWVDKVSNVTITPAAVVAANAPTTSGGVLTAVQDTATPLSTANFGYSDPNSVALGSVQIVSLPALGTLKYNGSTVVSSALPLTVTAANLANLTYQGATNGYATPYTQIGIKVANANDVWSSTAWLTVNVTRLNRAPTSIGGSVILKPNTVKTFAAVDFPFTDVDAGDTLGAIKVVTTLPAYGTLSLNGTPITSVPSAVIPVANIGTLTYTPDSNYLGADSFKFQVRDAALFSADATMAITVTPDITVQNGSFETTGAVTDANWTRIAPLWNPSPDSANGQSRAGAFFTNAADGTWYASFMTAGFSITQDLQSTVNAGDVLSVTFYLGKDTTQSGIVTASLMVGSTPYSQNFDTTSQAVGTWEPYTLTATLANAGNLSLKFSSVSGRAWLDKIDRISVIPTNAPSSANATLTISEDTPTALTAGNFGYVDPNLAALAAVQITSLPALGTLKLNGSPVSNGALPLTIAAANIGNLTYQPAANGNGTAYATIGTKVMNANNVWSLNDAVMTVNATPVNDTPTSTGASAILATGTDKTFLAGDFPFADVDAGETISAIKITSLPAHGTLNLNGTPITSVPSAAILVANIGTLTYTPTANYSGADSFNYQVKDATIFSADATMAMTVNYAEYIAVQNGSFEITNPGDQTWSDGNWAFIPSPWTTNLTNYGRIKYSSAPVGFPVLGSGNTWMANMMNSANWINQSLGSQSFSAGETISVTFYLCRDSSGSGILQASFMVGADTYSQTFDTTAQTVNTWQSYTLTQTIPTAVTANLSLKFANVSGKAGWLDNISNVSVMSASGVTPAIAATGSPLAAMSTISGTASAATSFTVSGANMTAGILVTAPTGLEVSQSSGSGYGSTTTVGSSGTIASTTVYVRLAATAPVGSYNSQNIVLSSSGAISLNVTTSASGNSVDSSSPVITLEDTLGAVNTTYGTASATPTSFRVSGSLLTGNLLVTPPSGYEVSLSSGTGYTTGLTITASGTLISTQVFVRLAATAGVANSPYLGNITVSGGGANSKTIATASSAVSKATPTASLALSNSTVTYDGTAKSASVSITTSSVPGAVQNVLTGGAATQTAAGTYAVTANFVPTDATNYNTLTAQSAGNFVINNGTSVTTIPVANGSFESPLAPNTATYWWRVGNGWTPSTVSNFGVYNINDGGGGNPFPAAADGKYGANLFGIKNITQDLGTQTFLAGDQLSVTFYGGMPNSGLSVQGGLFYVKFIVGGITYTSSAYDTRTQAAGTWQAYTFTQTIPADVTGNFKIQFSVDTTQDYRPWLDNISNISVIAAPVPGSDPTYATWATAHSVSGGVTDDPNHDGVQNGIAYFMGTTGPANNPGLIGNTVTWTNGGNIPSSAYGTQFVVQTSPDLVNWTPAASTDPKLNNTAGSVSYTLPPAVGKTFVRLVVTPD